MAVSVSSEGLFSLEAIKMTIKIAVNCPKKKKKNYDKREEYGFDLVKCV